MYLDAMNDTVRRSALNLDRERTADDFAKVNSIFCWQMHAKNIQYNLSFFLTGEYFLQEHAREKHHRVGRVPIPFQLFGIPRRSTFIVLGNFSYRRIRDL